MNDWVKTIIIILVLSLFKMLLIGQSDWKNKSSVFPISQLGNIYSIMSRDGKKYFSDGKFNFSIAEKSTFSSSYLSTMNTNLFPLTIRANFMMDYIWIYNKYENEGDTLIILEDSLLTVWRPEGSYLTFAGEFDTTYQHILITKDSIELYSPIEIQLFKEDAERTVQFELFKETAAPLFKSVITFYFYSRLNKPGFSISNFGAGIDPFILKFNSMPPYFDQEWAVKGKQLHNDGNLYLLSGELKTTQIDTTIMNNPSNFGYADFHYHYPDSLKFGHYFQLSTLFPNFHWAGGGDPIYTHPFQVRIYQDTSVDFTLRSSTFIQFLSSNAMSYISTQELRINDNKVTGYFLSDRGAPSYMISKQGESTHLGLVPAYWFGKFFNRCDTIKIRSSHGRFDHLFLSQTNDALLHYDIGYHIYSNGNLVKTGNFPHLAGGPIMFLGFNPDSLTIPISPGAYEMVITDNHYELAAQAGISQVRAVFDLNQPDKNPPNIILFQIHSDNELANVINPANNNWIRFILEEGENLNTVQLFYSIMSDTVWHEIPVNFSDPYWEAQIPYLSDGFYSLKLVASDNTQNYIDCLMEPAFLVDESTGLQGKYYSRSKNYPKYIQLYANYPNPFNSETEIKYQILYPQNVTISIYNINGCLIKTLKKNVQEFGSRSIHWDGKDNIGRSVSSGIYYYQLKTENSSCTKKAILIK